MRVDRAEFGQLELDQQVDPCLEGVGAIQGQGKAKLGVDDSSKAPVLTLGVSADLLHEFCDNLLLRSERSYSVTGPNSSKEARGEATDPPARIRGVHEESVPLTLCNLGPIPTIMSPAAK
jgi:hypothetical protein